LWQFQTLGLASAHLEPFPCVSLRKSSVELAIGTDHSLKRVAARAIAGAPATPGNKAIETELVWIEMPEQGHRHLNASLKGKVAVLIGPLPTDAALHKRLVAAKPAAVIHVDDRLPFDWLKDDGVYPTWARRYGMPPTINIPFQHAWKLRRQGANRARIKVAVDQGISESQNVVAEIPGRRPDLPLVLLGAHHDTQCNNVGADDNASGVVAILEIAAMLRSARPLRTVRFVSFGTEEQLSVGSAQYVCRHRRELAQIGVVLNIDTVSSVLGHHIVCRGGTNEFGAWVMREIAKRGLDARQNALPMPFADHFPFSVFGVPSVSFLRSNIHNGIRWQHHSAHDNLTNVSVAELARAVNAVAGVAHTLANQPRWQFKRGLALTRMLHE
jgi:hypothetical protein